MEKSLIRWLIDHRVNDIDDVIAVPGKSVTFLNLYSYKVLRDNLSALSQIDHVGFDGISLCKLYRWAFNVNTLRVSFDFTSLADLVFSKIVDQKLSFYVIGSKQKEIEKTINVLSNRYAFTEKYWWRNGYFDNEQERENCLNEIASLSPDVVIVGMGTPQQELFLSNLRQRGWCGSGYTCGGFIHQISKSGDVDYYPEILNKLNLRWFYRIIDEPKLFFRYFIKYPKSLLLFLYDVFLFKRN